jgi:hypothetical protein
VLFAAFLIKISAFVALEDNTGFVVMIDGVNFDAG